MTLLDGTRIELRTGWRRWGYRGRHHRRTSLGHLTTGLTLFYAVYLR